MSLINESPFAYSDLLNEYTANIDMMNTNSINATVVNISETLNIASLTPNKFLASDNESNVVTRSLNGTTNQVIVSTAGSTTTLSTPQDIGPTSTPAFANIQLTGQPAKLIFGTDASGNFLPRGFQGQSDMVLIGMSGNDISLTLPQGVATSSTPTFAGMTLNGPLGISGNINGSPSSSITAGSIITTNAQVTSLTPSLPVKSDVSNNLVSSLISLGSDVTGLLPIANGGTNSSTALTNGKLMQSTSGKIVEGTDSAHPVFQNLDVVAPQITPTQAKTWISGYQNKAILYLDATGPTNTGGVQTGGQLTYDYTTGVTSLWGQGYRTGSGNCDLYLGFSYAPKIIQIEGNTQRVYFNSGVQSFSYANGAIVVPLGGGIGVSGNINSGGNLSVFGTSQLSGDISTVGNVSILGTGNLSVAGTSTLTGNTSVGGNLTVGGNVTVNGIDPTYTILKIDGTNKVVSGLVNLASDVTGILPGYSGGFDGTLPLNRVTFSNANFSMYYPNCYVAQIGTMTAARTVTLPIIASYRLVMFIIGDESGTVNATNKLTLNTTSPNTINGFASYDIVTPNGSIMVISDGSNNWSVRGLMQNAAQAATGFVSSGAQTFGGQKTFAAAITSSAASNQLVFQPNGSGNSLTLTAANPATASRTFTLPDVGSNSTFAMLDGTQTFPGAKTFSSVISPNAGINGRTDTAAISSTHIGYMVPCNTYSALTTTTNTWKNMGAYLTIPSAGVWLVYARVTYTVSLTAGAELLMQVSTDSSNLGNVGTLNGGFTLAATQVAAFTPDTPTMVATGYIRTTGSTIIYIKMFSGSYSSTINCAPGQDGGYAVRIA